jgi:hypothetical protein
MKTILMFAAIALVGWLGINFFIDGMPTWKTAILIVVLVAIVIATMFMCLRFFTQTLQARFGPQQPAHIVDTAWRNATPAQLPQGYYPPQAQLSPPQTITVPRYSVNGTPRPMNMPVLQTTNDAGETLGVPLDKLMRFLALPTPKRAEWVGDTTLYSDCLEFCGLHGLLDRKPNGGASWKGEYPLESRKQWVLQFEGHRARDE